MAGVKMVKHIFTVSFTLQAIGWSELLLAAFYVTADIWKLRRGTGLLLLFGQFVLTAYVCRSVFGVSCQAAGDWLFVGFRQFVPEAYGDVVAAVGCSIVIIAVVIIRRRLAMKS